MDTRGRGLAVGQHSHKDGWTGLERGGGFDEGDQSGEGYVEFTVPSTAGNWMAGLGKGDTDQSYGDIDYAIYLYNGYVYVYEAGQYGAGSAATRPGNDSGWQWRAGW